MDVLLLDKYNIAAKICTRVYNKLKEKIIQGERCIKTLYIYGNNEINNELDKIFKKEQDKYIAFPVSISLNDIISNYVYDDNEMYNEIKDDSIIKIELGVSVCGCICILAETFTINENTFVKETMDLLNNVQKELLTLIKDKETVDEVRIFIESECTELNVFPVENCTSFQTELFHLSTSDSKYMILNNKQYYDKNDYLITRDNINFEFEENDVINVNLTVIPMGDDNIDEIKYLEYNIPQIYNLTDVQYNLKLKSSKEFYNIISKNHSNYAFDMTPYLSSSSKSSSKNKLGSKECITHDLLQSHPIKFTKNKLPVVTKKFTIIVGKTKSKLCK